MALGNYLGFLLGYIWRVNWRGTCIGAWKLLWRFIWVPTLFFSLRGTWHTYQNYDTTFNYKISWQISWGIYRNLDWLAIGYTTGCNP